MTEMDELLTTAAVQPLVVKYWNDVVPATTMAASELAAVKARQASAEKDRANA